MKNSLILLLCFLAACTQGPKRDGGWAKKRRPNNPEVESPSEETTKSEQPDRRDEPSAREANMPSPSVDLPQPPFEVNDLPALALVPLPAKPLASFANFNEGNDFVVDFNAVGHLMPPGLMYGINDLQNASQGAWTSWAEAVTPTGGMLRLWGKYSKERFGQPHLDTALRAKAAGLDVLFTCVGTSAEMGRDLRSGVHLEREPDPGAWTRDIIRDVKKMREKGINVSHIEIWNEPNLGDSWPGDVDSFGTFFAKSGNLLRAEFGNTISLGGPGLAGTLGDKMEWPKAIFAACKREGFQPDFYSWHQYGSFPTEHDMLQVPQVILHAAQAQGLGLNQMILSEWNVGLPHPSFPHLDDERAANYYMATVISLANTQASHASFFFLQDAPWDTNKEMAGESVGVFTLAGAPKALLSGMRMMATAGDLPMMPVERLGAPSNISCFASRDGDTGYLIAVNTVGGGLERHITRLLRRADVSLGVLRRNNKQVQDYTRGKASRESLRKLGIDDNTMDALDDIGPVREAIAREIKNGLRTVKIKLEGKPKGIRSVKVIDKKHGNPIADADFQRAYQPYSNGLAGASMDATIEQLRTEGVPQKELDILTKGMKTRSGNLSGVDRSTQRRARELFDANRVRLASEVPLELCALEATHPCPVEASSWCTLRGDILEIRLPMESSVLVELDW